MAQLLSRHSLVLVFQRPNKTARAP